MTPRAAPQSQGRIILQVVLQVLLIIGCIAFGVWLLYRLASIVLLLLLAALFAYLVAPLVALSERPVLIAGRRRRLSRGPAIALTYLIIAGSAWAGAVLLLPRAAQQWDDAISRGPVYAQSILAWERGWTRYYERLRMPAEVRQSIDQSLVTGGHAAVESARASLLGLVGALSNLPWLALIPILAFFFLKDAVAFRRALVAALPRRIRLRGRRLFDELNTTLAAYVRAQILACLLVGGVCGIGFAVMGIPYPVPLGVLAGVLEFIPLIGPLLLAVVASIVGALHAPALVFRTLGFLLVLRLIEDYVVYPRLIRHGLRLHPMAVIVAVLAGAELGGVAGIFLAVPGVAIAFVLYRHLREWRRADRIVESPLSAAPFGALHDSTHAH